MLHFNKKWKDNKSSVEDYFDFDKLRAGWGLQTMSMEEFLDTVAKPGLLKKPLPNNNTALIKQPLWDYLESACYVRQWSPGKLYIGFNITMKTTTTQQQQQEVSPLTVESSIEKITKDSNGDTKRGEEDQNSNNNGGDDDAYDVIGDFNRTDPSRLAEFSLGGRF